MLLGCRIAVAAGALAGQSHVASSACDRPQKKRENKDGEHVAAQLVYNHSKVSKTT